jgi:F-type H+-transporting ATPase subunit b
MESIISTFHIDWKIIIAQVVNFAIVFIVLYLFALKPLAKMMNERSGKIAKGLDDAKTHASLVEKSKEEYEKALTKAKEEANKIYEAGKREAEAKRLAMLEDTKKEIESMMISGKKVLEAEKVKVLEEAKKELINLTMLTTEKVFAMKGDAGMAEKAAELAMNEIKNV